jgi:hypothetical protein
MGSVALLPRQFLVPHLASIEPSKGSLHTLARQLGGRLTGDDMVESHGDVRRQAPLDLDGSFRRESSHGAIDVTLKLNAVLSDAAEPLEREDLKSARIREHRAVPGGELVEPTHGANYLLAGTEMKMIRIGQYYLSPCSAHILRAKPADDRVGTHRHERWCRYLPVWQGEGTRTGGSLGTLQVELKHETSLLSS